MVSSNKDITIYDIAKKLNISAATVSRGLKNHPAISKETKKRIENAANEMGYQFNFFASNLRTQKSYTLGVIVPRLNSNFMAGVLAGMEKAASKNGYNLIIGQSLESFQKEKENVAIMFNKRIDGLLISFAYDTKGTQHLKQFVNKNLPVIFFDRVFENSSAQHVVIDNYAAGYELTTHLINEGCKRILHLAGDLTKNVYAERYKGYKKALINSGLVFSEELLIISNLTGEDGKDAARRIITMKERPDAVFAANDVCAVECLLELKRLGIKIPGDIAVAGFNNDPICLIVEPNLTTINYPGAEMGELAVQTLIDQLNNNEARSYTLKHQLITRSSTQKTKRI